MHKKRFVLRKCKNKKFLHTAPVIFIYCYGGLAFFYSMMRVITFSTLLLGWCDMKNIGKERILL